MDFISFLDIASKYTLNSDLPPTPTVNVDDLLLSGPAAHTFTRLCLEWPAQPLAPPAKQEVCLIHLLSSASLSIPGIKWMDALYLIVSLHRPQAPWMLWSHLEFLMCLPQGLEGQSQSRTHMVKCEQGIG